MQASQNQLESSECHRPPSSEEYGGLHFTYTNYPNIHENKYSDFSNFSMPNNSDSEHNHFYQQAIPSYSNFRYNNYNSIYNPVGHDFYPSSNDTSATQKKEEFQYSSEIQGVSFTDKNKLSPSINCGTSIGNSMFNSSNFNNTTGNEFTVLNDYSYDQNYKFVNQPHDVNDQQLNSEIGSLNNKCIKNDLPAETYKYNTENTLAESDISTITKNTVEEGYTSQINYVPENQSNMKTCKENGAIFSEELQNIPNNIETKKTPANPQLNCLFSSELNKQDELMSHISNKGENSTQNHLPDCNNESNKEEYPNLPNPCTNDNECRTLDISKQIINLSDDKKYRQENKTPKEFQSNSVSPEENPFLNFTHNTLESAIPSQSAPKPQANTDNGDKFQIKTATGNHINSNQIISSSKIIKNLLKEERRESEDSVASIIHGFTPEKYEAWSRYLMTSITPSLSSPSSISSSPRLSPIADANLKSSLPNQGLNFSYHNHHKNPSLLNHVVKHERSHRRNTFSQRATRKYYRKNRAVHPSPLTPPDDPTFASMHWTNILTQHLQGYSSLVPNLFIPSIIQNSWNFPTLQLPASPPSSVEAVKSSTLGTVVKTLKMKTTSQPEIKTLNLTEAAGVEHSVASNTTNLNENPDCAKASYYANLNISAKGDSNVGKATAISKYLCMNNTVLIFL